MRKRVCLVTIFGSAESAGLVLKKPWNSTINQNPRLLTQHNQESTQYLFFMRGWGLGTNDCWERPWSFLPILLISVNQILKTFCTNKLLNLTLMALLLHLLGWAWVSPTLAWLHCTRVWVRMLVCLFGPTTCRKFQISASKYFTMIHFPHRHVYNSAKTMRMRLKGYCQPAALSWKRVRANSKMIQVECVDSTHGNLLSW